MVGRVRENIFNNHGNIQTKKWSLLTHSKDTVNRVKCQEFKRGILDLSLRKNKIHFTSLVIDLDTERS